MNVITATMMVFLPVTMVSVFAFTSVASWADARRREREAFYRSETLKKIAESTGPGAAAALEVIREQERVAARLRHEGQRLGGFVSIAVGVALTIFLKAMVQASPVYLVGLIPLAAGLALLAHVVAFPPKD